MLSLFLCYTHKTNLNTALNIKVKCNCNCSLETNVNKEKHCIKIMQTGLEDGPTSNISLLFSFVGEPEPPGIMTHSRVRRRSAAVHTARKSTPAQSLAAASSNGTQTSTPPPSPTSQSARTWRFMLTQVWSHMMYSRRSLVENGNHPPRAPNTVSPLSIGRVNYRQVKDIITAVFLQVPLAPCQNNL